MNLSGVTFRGPEISDQALFDILPEDLRILLSEINGFILHNGALHVRGACVEPEWHSLRYAMMGRQAFHELYGVVESTDVPFAQDCMGDQYLLREHRIVSLFAETGEIEELGLSLEEFFAEAAKDPEEFLNWSPNHILEPGQLLLAYPPFCMEATEKGHSLKACPADEVIRFHADLARQIANLKDGDTIEIKVID